MIDWNEYYNLLNENCIAKIDCDLIPQFSLSRTLVWNLHSLGFDAIWNELLEIHVKVKT